MPAQQFQLNSVNAVANIQTDQATLPSVGSVGVNIGGLFTGTLSFLFSIDGINFFPWIAFALSATGVSPSPVSSTTSAGQFAIPVYGFAQIQVKMSSYTSGTAVVTLDLTVGAAPLQPQTVLDANTSSGGPPLLSGLASNVTTETAFTDQGKGSRQMNLSIPTNTGDVALTFLDNPWIQGLQLGSRILLSNGPNTAAQEEVIVAATGNTPAIGPGPAAIQLVTPVVNPRSSYATFDAFETDGGSINSTGPAVPGISVAGITGQGQYFIDPNPQDQKRPFQLARQAVGNTGIQALIENRDLMGAAPNTKSLAYQEQILQELRNLVYLVAQLKDPGPMDVPTTVTEPRVDLAGN